MISFFTIQCLTFAARTFDSLLDIEIITKQTVASYVSVSMFFGARVATVATLVTNLHTGLSTWIVNGSESTVFTIHNFGKIGKKGFASIYFGSRFVE